MRRSGWRRRSPPAGSPEIADASAGSGEEHEAELREGASVPDFGDGAPYARYLMEMTASRPASSSSRD